LLEEFRVYRRTFHKQIEIAVHPLQFGQGYFRHDFKLTEFEAISNSGAIVAAVAAASSDGAAELQQRRCQHAACQQRRHTSAQHVSNDDTPAPITPPAET
jgi:hypothetical protein